MLPVQPVEPLHLAGPLQFRLRLLGEPAVEARVAAPDLPGLPALFEPLQRVLAHGLEHPVPDLARPADICDDQGLLHQPAQQLQHVFDGAT